MYEHDLGYHYLHLLAQKIAQLVWRGSVSAHLIGLIWFSTCDYPHPLKYLKLVSRPPHTPKYEVFTFLDELEPFEYL